MSSVASSAKSVISGADTLARSVVLLLVLTVLQRVIGFGRGLLFCRWLTPEQLGEWELSFSFLMMVCPIAVLSLPGVFGRYLEYYRVRGQLRMFLRRTAVATLVMSSVSVLVIAAASSWFSQMIFGARDQQALVWLLAATLWVLVIYSFAVELFTALRQQGVSSNLQLINTLAFAGVSAIALLWGGQLASASGMVLAYLIAATVAIAAAMPLMWRLWAEAPAASESVDATSFWRRLMPFAFSIWATSGLTSLFSLVDRYLIVHHSGLDADTALANVGQYHTARLMPMLILTFANLLGAILVPHLSHEWEAHGRRAVSARLTLILKLMSLSLLPQAVVMLGAAPLIFELLCPGKFGAGLYVLPWTMCYCAIASLGCVARAWLWCDERAWLSNLAYLAGLLVSLVCGILWVPTLGLTGAAAAATLGNVAAHAGILAFNRRRGMNLDAGAWILMFLPLVIIGGTAATAVAALISAWLVLRTEWLLNHAEKRQIVAALADYAYKFRLERLAARLKSAV